MPRLGAHFSIAGGLHKAVETAERLQCDTLQLFSKNSNQWNAPPLKADEIKTFRDLITRTKIAYPTAHDSYLINLASPKDDLFQKSIDAFVVELERAEALGLSYLVTHPGAHVGSGDEAGLKRVVEGLNEAHRRTSGFRVLTLLETTAGQGSTLGHRFEHIATLLNEAAHPERLGVCLDTCHVFAAGYDLRTEETYQATMAEFDRVVGFDRLRLFHLNDSVKGLGSRVDRHAGLGQGMIGTTPFQLLVRDPRFADRPMILETPKENDAGEEMDPVNLGILRSFLSKKGRK